ncbi:hypothetical protein D3C73_1401420 [compost metagenome]
MGDIVSDFFKKIKDYIKSNMFQIKLDSNIKRIATKSIDNFNNLCKNWYESYNDFDIDKINSISKKLDSSIKKVAANNEMIKENKIIQNMTSLINAKKDKLSKMQLQICETL